MGAQKKGHKAAGTANKTKNSLTKVVVKSDDVGEWVRPGTLDKFYIDEEATFPSIIFEIKTDQPGPYKWSWSIKWDALVSAMNGKSRKNKVATFPMAYDTIVTKGKFTQDQKSWDAKAIGHVIGGKLTVTVEAGTKKFKRTVLVRAKSPSKARIDAYIEEKVNGGGNSNKRDNEQDRATAIATMKKIAQKESHYRQFMEFDDEPVVSFDKGYGLTQLTSLNPTYEQVWNWKVHLDEALRRMVGLRKQSVQRFNKKPTWYHDDAMIETNAISLWNGGHYYAPNKPPTKWIREPKMICVPNHGNMGYLLSEDEVGKKTLKDMQEEKRTPKYTGVCYADAIAAQ